MSGAEQRAFRAGLRARDRPTGNVANWAKDDRQVAARRASGPNIVDLSLPMLAVVLAGCAAAARPLRSPAPAAAAEHGAVALFRFDLPRDRGDDPVAASAMTKMLRSFARRVMMSCVRPELDRDPPPHQRQSSSARASAI